MTRKLRSTDALLKPAVSAAIGALGLDAEDGGAARLAELYAAEIDDSPEEARAEALERLGPRLLTVLDALGATPKARKAVGNGAPVSGGAMERLRAARSS